MVFVYTSIKLLFLSLLIVIIFNACKKDKDNDPKETIVECLIIKKTTHEGVSSNYIYDSNKNLTKTEGSTGFDYVLEYKNNNLIKTTILNPTSDTLAYSTYQYNNQNQVERQTHFDFIVNSPKIAMSYLDFEYNTKGQIIKTKLYDPEYKEEYISYSILEWNDEGNLVNIKTYSGSFTDTPDLYIIVSKALMEYDKQKNPLSKDPNYLLSYCKNNLTSYKVYTPSNDLAISLQTTYEYNEYGYPINATELKENDIFNSYYEYKYNCETIVK